MSDAIDGDLYRRTRALLEPGDIELTGLVVHTDLGSDSDIEMMQATLDVGDVIAKGAGFEPTDVYVYSGNDDSDFSSNQHQGLTIDGDEFVWECQQLLRNGTFDVVFYFESGADVEGIVADAEAAGHRVHVVET